MSARDDAATYAVILEADHAASVAHDFIYGLNDVTQEQASAAIWTIHNALRPLIVLEGDDVAGNLEGDLKDKLANEDAVALRNYLASAAGHCPQAVPPENTPGGAGCTDTLSEPGQPVEARAPVPSGEAKTVPGSLSVERKEQR